MELRKNSRKHQSKNQYEKRKAYKPKQPFCAVEGVGSPAWRKLHMRSVGIFMEFHSKFNGYNRYNLSLTYREVMNKMSSLLFTRSIWELIGFGFLDLKRTGRLERYCSLYGISDRWKRLSNDPEKLCVIEELLNEIEQMKRQPGSLKKRMEMWKLRHEVLKLGNHPEIRHT